MSTTDVQLRVSDMKCEGCAQRVRNVLERLKGVRSAEVTLDDKTAEVEIEDGTVEFDDVKAAVGTAGYTVKT